MLNCLPAILPTAVSVSRWTTSPKRISCCVDLRGCASGTGILFQRSHTGTVTSCAPPRRNCSYTSTLPSLASGARQPSRSRNANALAPSALCRLWSSPPCAAGGDRRVIQTRVLSTQSQDAYNASTLFVQGARQRKPLYQEAIRGEWGRENKVEDPRATSSSRASSGFDSLLCAVGFRDYRACTRHYYWSEDDRHRQCVLCQRRVQWDRVRFAHLISNAMATCFLAYKIWQHRKLVRMTFGAGFVVTGSIHKENALAILIESGLIQPSLSLPCCTVALTHGGSMLLDDLHLPSPSHCWRFGVRLAGLCT
ncbi:hypothetical protein C8Q80DRAFT_1146647 [Daedaleopsis nitida]|nr:hypothetical protein C8Q80DRAFT_1146647 [Daedaleopsis nitida]